MTQKAEEQAEERTTGAEQGQDRSMKRLAGILAENGVTGIYPYEADSKLTRLPCIRFEAPEDDHEDYGKQIAGIALEYGYPLVRVMRCWSYRKGKFYRPEWEIEFMRIARESKFDGRSLCRCGTRGT